MIQRIGLFGGTFDPIHNGHLRLAETAMMECRLEKILFLPAAYPPHKELTQLTPLRHRAEMLRLALEGKTRYECSLVEAQLSSPSYTVETLRFLKKYLPPAAELFFLIGIDAFLEICTWKGYDELLREVSFVVSEREGNLAEQKLSLARTLNYRQVDQLWITADGRKKVYFLHIPPLVISSSAIREAVKAERPFGSMVPDAVCEYIMLHRLYCQK